MVADSINNTSQQSDCICKSNFWWNSAAGQCQLNCRLINNTVGSNLDRLTCDCELGFYWSQGKCWKSCINQPATDKNYNYSLCECKPGFSLKADGCWRDCSGVLNSTGSNINKLECGCTSIFVWAFTECTINCLKIPSSTGVSTSR